MAAMGVRRCQKKCALLAFAAGLALAGCRNDLDRDPKVGGNAGEGARLLLTDPQETKPVDPSSPGLEPPLGSAGTAAGPMTMNPGMTPPPGAPTGGSGAAPVSPPASGGFAGAAAGGAGGANSAGSGAAAGGSGGSATTDPGDAGASDPCATEPECGLLAPACADSLHCIALEGCDHAICITVEAACLAECDSTECAVLESYPEQIACN
jgi:hypothetical protein